MMPLPQPRDFEVDAITTYLQHLHWSNRPAKTAARVLAFATHMNWLQGRRPWPTRPVVAKHLGMPEITLDVVLRQRGAEGLLRREVTYEPGRILRVVPSDDIMGVFAGARFKAA